MAREALVHFVDQLAPVPVLSVARHFVDPQRVPGRDRLAPKGVRIPVIAPRMHRLDLRDKRVNCLLHCRHRLVSFATHHASRLVTTT